MTRGFGEFYNVCGFKSVGDYGFTFFANKKLDVYGFANL